MRRLPWWAWLLLGVLAGGFLVLLTLLVWFLAWLERKVR